MKKLLIMCGAGHATSTVVRTKVNRWLKEEELENQVEIKQSAVGQELESIKNGEYDIVLSTTQVPDDIKDKVCIFKGENFKMKFLHEQLKLKTVSNRPSYHNITSDVKKIFEKSQINNGVVIVSSPHTTCSVYFDEYMHDVNYYGDDLLQVDLNEVLEKIIPTQTTEGQYHSPGPEHIKYGMAKTDPNYPALEWTMLNTDGHLRSDLLGASESFIVRDGKLLIGEVGSIYFVDFDQTRERNRMCNIMVMGE